MFTHADLIWQFDWRGERLLNLRRLVCSSCLDKPQEQLRARILGPDPLPIYNARPEQFAPTGVSVIETNVIELLDLNTALATEAGAMVVPEGVDYGN